MKKHFAKQIFAAALAISFVCGLSACREREEEQLTLKPVIYLYPEEKTDISVTLAYDGTLTCTYPNYKTGWHVSAKPDGTLTQKLRRKAIRGKAPSFTESDPARISHAYTGGLRILKTAFLFRP